MVRCHCYEIWQILSELVGTGHQRKTNWWDANTAAGITGIYTIIQTDRLAQKCASAEIRAAILRLICGLYP